MVTFTKNGSEIWRDYSTDGVPSSGRKEPVKSEIRTWTGTVESTLSPFLDTLFAGRSSIIIGGVVSQSNLYANDTSTGGSFTGTNAKVRAWSNAGAAFGTATLGADPFRPNSGSGIPNNCLFQFGKWMQEQTGADIKLFLHAIPDTEATVWLTVANGGPNNSTNRYDGSTSTAGGIVLKTQTLVTAMMASSEMVATGRSKFDILVIWRGESDQNYGVDANEANFLKLIDQLRSESWADDNTLILICELVEEQNKYPGAQEAWRRIVRNRARPNLALSSSYGLVTVGDGTHANGTSLETVGRSKLPLALKSLIAPPRVPGAYDGRNNLINVNAASSSSSKITVSVKASNTVIQTLWNTTDTWIDVPPTNLGQGDNFTVQNFSNIYSTIMSPGSGSLFSADAWDKNYTSFTIGPGEAYSFIKVGPSDTAAYMVTASFQNFSHKLDLKNAIPNGSLEMGNKFWNLGVGYAINRDSTNAFTGNWVVAFTDNTDTAKYLESIFAPQVNPNDMVLVEAMNKTSAGAGVTSLRSRMVWLDKARAEISDSTGTNFTSASTTWRKVMAWAKAPANTVFSMVRQQTRLSSGTAWWDNIVMRVFRSLDIFQDEWLVQAADRAALTSNTSLQNIFTTAAGGQVTLDPGLYWVDIRFRMTGLSASSGDIKSGFGGSATVTYELSSKTSKSTTAASSSADEKEITAASATSLIAANTGDTARVHIYGLINVTAGGTWIPQVAQGVASTAVIKALAYARVQRLPTDTSGILAMGAWS